MSMPTNRQSFKEHCLRRLGAPVITINVNDDQVDDRIDEALRYYWDYHFDGTEKLYYKYQLTQQDFDNKWIPIPENIIGVINIFDISSQINSGSMFDVRYQIALNDMFQYTRESLIPYYMMFTHIQLFEQLLVGRQPIRYNRHIDRLYIDMDYNRLAVGNWIIVEAYQIVDPDTYQDVWADRWLIRYATALIKRQWGANLSKFAGVQLMGGYTFNGDRIYTEAIQEIEELESEMIRSYSMPLITMIG